MPVNRQSVGRGAIIIMATAANFVASRARLLAASLGVIVTLSPGAQAATENVGSQSGLQVPRFVSLKADRVNVRGGPTRDNDVVWVYTHAGLPVEITAEYGNWRRIRDWEGGEGWVYHSLLSGRRTALVVPQDKDALVSLYDDADRKSTVTAKLHSGVLAGVKRCTGTWCHIAGNGFDGWIEQNRLWGAYPNEKVE